MPIVGDHTDEDSREEREEGTGITWKKEGLKAGRAVMPESLRAEISTSLLSTRQPSALQLFLIAWPFSKKIHALT